MFDPITILSQLPSPNEASSNQYKAKLPILLLGITPTQYKNESIIIISDLTPTSQSLNYKHSYKIGNFKIPNDLLFSCIITKPFLDYIRQKIKQRQSPGEYINTRKNNLDDDFLFGKIEFNIYEKEGNISGKVTKLELATDSSSVYQLFNDSIEFYRLLNLLKEKCHGSNYLKQIYSKYNLLRYEEDSIKDESQVTGPSLKIRKTGSNLLFNHTVEDSQDSLFPETQKMQVLDELEEKEGQEEDREQKEKEEQKDEEGPSLQIPSSMSSTTFFHTPPSQDITSCLINKTTIEQLLLEESKDPGTHLGKLYQITAKITGMIPFKPFIIKPYKRTIKITPFKLVLSSNLHTMTVDFKIEEDLCGFLNISEVEEIYQDMKQVQYKVSKLLHEQKQQTLMLKRRVKHIEYDDTMALAYWTLESTLNNLIE